MILEVCLQLHFLGQFSVRIYFLRLSLNVVNQWEQVDATSIGYYP